MDETLQIGGLPLHPLIVHVVVVLTPLTVLATLLAQFWPAARRRLGVVTPIAAAVVVAIVPITVAAGESLLRVVGPVPAVLEHERRARMLLPWTIALLVVSAAQWAWFRWGAPRFRAERRRLGVAVYVVLAVAVAAVAVGTSWLLVLIGDSGARAVWGGILPH